MHLPPPTRRESGGGAVPQKQSEPLLRAATPPLVQRLWQSPTDMNSCAGWRASSVGPEKQPRYSNGPPGAATAAGARAARTKARMGRKDGFVKAAIFVLGGFVVVDVAGFWLIRRRRGRKRVL